LLVPLSADCLGPEVSFGYASALVNNANEAQTKGPGPEAAEQDRTMTAPLPIDAQETHSRLKRLLRVLSETAADWMQDNAMRLSAALSLYTILSLAPLLVITLKVIALVLRNKDYAREQMTQQVSSLMGPQTADAIRPMIEGGAKGGHGALAAVVSTAVLIFSATGVFAELQDAMNTIWGVKPKPNQGIWGFVRHRLLSVGMVFGIAFLLLVSMFVSTALAAIARYIAGNGKWLAFVADVIVSFGVVTLLFAAIFKFLPDVMIRWRHVWLGAAITALLFTLGKYTLTLYFKFASPTSAFGAAGSLGAVLLWVYSSSFILCFGAEFTKVWALHRERRIRPAQNAVKVTEEDRAQRGIPSEQRMRASLAGSGPDRPGDRPAAQVYGPPPIDEGERPRRRIGPTSYLLAAGAFAGGVAITYYLQSRWRAGVCVPVR